MPGQVTVHSGDRLTHDVEARSHRLTADEPIEAGGADLGMTPYELLLAALGSCTSMTLLMYSRRKGWALSTVVVTLRHERVHARDCEDCETVSGHIDTIYRVIKLEGELSDEQRSRLLEIAEKCPVHRTLQAEIKIRTSIDVG